MRTTVDTVPTALFVLLVVGGVVGIVLVSALAVRRFVPATREGFDAEVSSQMFEAMQAARPFGSRPRVVLRRLGAAAQRRSRRTPRSPRRNADRDLPFVIAALTLVGSIVILGYVTLVGYRSAAFHLIGAGSIAGVIGFPLVVLLLGQFPFSGGRAVETTPFREGVLAPLLAGSK